ncbi:MAG: hypothetical protein EX269_04000 [Acidimicrobiales bacterium]|nr:MAG: hypothetical protein EX269_04000 [Acidimicrobiales bacterium]
MTETTELNIEAALARIDENLLVLAGRELMSAAEVSDLLLDLRLELAASSPLAEAVDVAALAN